MGVQLSGDFKGTLWQMEKQMPGIQKQALYAAAKVLKDAARERMTADFPASTHQNSKYKDTIADAVRMTKVDESEVTVHVMGTREKGSRTYMARFFEKGTKKRYAKTFKGRKLKKRRYLGQITPMRFFRKAVDSNMQQALKRMEEVFSQRIANLNKK